MKTTKILCIVLLSLLFCSEAFSQIKNNKPVPKGLYFIVNEKGEALQPLGGTPGEFVYLHKFNKSGMQKWLVIPQKNGRYLIQFYDSNIYLEPHPAEGFSAVLLDPETGYMFSAVPGTDHLWYIKSKERRGDAMMEKDRKNIVWSGGKQPHF
ncbi:MAG: hypothetical protein LC096_08285 [Bacteroidia bacterium]|nr:hypothetical protein [Bacteroidia bacterium]